MIKLFIIMVNILFLFSTACKKKVLLPNAPPQNFETVQEAKNKILNESEKMESTNIESFSAPRIPATIKSENKSKIGFQISGMITKSYVKAGDFVKKGQILASLDNMQTLLEVKSAANFLQEKKLNFQLEKKKYFHNIQQFRAGVLSQSSLETEKNIFESAKLDFKTAKTNLESKKYALKLTNLSAPFSGIIAQSYKSLGDFVSIGEEVFDLVQNTDLSVYAQVPLSFYNKIKSGMVFNLVDPLRPFKGEILIIKVVPVIDSVSSTFDVYAKIKKFNRDLIPGEYVEILM